jgi:allantoin racemase
VRLLVTNCNTSAAVSALIGDEARRAARAGTEILVRTPSWGVSSAESWYDSYISAASVLDLVTAETERFDAVVMAGFGEPGREGLREHLEVPVVDITEAAVVMAAPLGRRYAILTSLGRTSAQITASLLTAGLLGAGFSGAGFGGAGVGGAGLDRAGLVSGCAGVYAIEQPVLELVKNPEATVAALVGVGRRAVTDGAEVLVVGCAGMSSSGPKVSAELGVPVVDGLAAGIKFAEGLVDLGLQTSKISGYAPPPAKSRPGWPPSAHRNHWIGPDPYPVDEAGPP